MTTEASVRRIENAVGELCSAIYAESQIDTKKAYTSVSAAISVLSGMKMDMIKSGKLKYEDL